MRTLSLQREPGQDPEIREPLLCPVPYPSPLLAGPGVSPGLGKVISLSTAPLPTSCVGKDSSPTQSGRSGTSEYQPHTPSPSGFQGLIISTSIRSLLIFLQNVFHDFTDITAAHYEWKRSGKSPGGSRAPGDWAPLCSAPPPPQLRRTVASKSLSPARQDIWARWH